MLSGIAQKSTGVGCKTLLTSFITPHSTPDAISRAGEKMFLAIYKAHANEHNLNNNRYAAFLKSSTKIKANLSSISPTDGTASNTRLAMCIYFRYLPVALPWYLYYWCTSKRRGVRT
ncbi:hypothetical protein AVEN_220341-1 [Araneus ventricosus]|uniref:Uncharacterized protein n=1 Tax=Araneus ventricosus TaxID=182803 RepID=A0A4Y2PYF6_ARAVE|nr:hypothetical protein AVEN_220341-1 [Araneus ventricosus]